MGKCDNKSIEFKSPESGVLLGVPVLSPSDIFPNSSFKWIRPKPRPWRRVFILWHHNVIILVLPAQHFHVLYSLVFLVPNPEAPRIFANILAEPVSILRHQGGIFYSIPGQHSYLYPHRVRCIKKPGKGKKSARVFGLVSKFENSFLTPTQSIVRLGYPKASVT